ncbi:60S ribosomal protein L27 [Hondaea fermentalgiana]|uniref:60S ribosomal protein L27 n=1 Tax=Hondaea fermentalgiana TaxID=2315210 RepID=A0A2R5GLK4_9STRA|nr:60S ribosomal protein L27 [Hondaea fermentalgiana]|eukprot:GBG31757.1 60S ribosomal protein L27 [Hondaea fermentalgiana]
MGKFLKQGKVVVVLQGKYAGRKAVIVKASEEGNKGRKFGHVLVAGIYKQPQKITRKMGKKKVAARSKIRPFVKFLNLNHVMPTRYQVDLELKKLEAPAAKDAEDQTPVQLTLDEETMADASKRVQLKKALKKVMEEGYFSQDQRKANKAAEGVKYFYEKLRF